MVSLDTGSIVLQCMMQLILTHSINPQDKEVPRHCLLYTSPESSFLEMLRNKFYIGKIRVPAYKGEPEYYVNGEHCLLYTSTIPVKPDDNPSDKTEKEGQ